jgi:hypothetical protein
MNHINRNDDNELPDDVGIRADWVEIAETASRTIAEFAVNGLKSYDIPAVIDAKAGFLGAAGLQLRSMRTGKLDMFRILVPAEYREEATEVVKIFLGSDEADISHDTDNNDEEE